MKATLFLRAIVLALVGATFLSAQVRPDFSGRWKEDETQRISPYTAPATGGAKAIGGPPPELVITHTPETLVIVEEGRFGPRRLTYALSGAEGVNKYGAVIETTRTKWDRNRLVTEGTAYQVTSQGESMWKIRIVRSLRAGGEMVVEDTRVDEDDQSRTLVRVYRKK
jgi:hypothetical protein